MNDVISSFRKRYRDRFGGTTDWFRLVSLGIILVVFSITDFCCLWSYPTATRAPSGMASAFAGVTTIIIIAKIAKPHLYADWMLNGTLCLLAGVLFNAGSMPEQMPILAAGCCALAASCLARLWIGLTASPPHAAYWVFVSGCFAAAGLMWVGVAIHQHWIGVPRLVLAADVLLQGVCLIGFGTVLHSCH